MSSVYQIVQEKFIKAIEEAIKSGGTLPWERPWQGGIPCNYITRRPYRGINLFLLPSGGEYITFNQIKKLQEKNKDIKIKKGCHKHMIVYWNFIKKTEKKGDKEEEKTVPLLRYYSVFHINDIEGIESKYQTFQHDPIEEAEKVISDYVDRSGIGFGSEFDSDKAYYSPKSDKVIVPSKDKFKRIEEYYSTTFHELVHSSGHPSRLGRFHMDESTIFGSDSYSKEELVAEMGSAMIMGILGIETTHSEKNSIAYLQSWLSVIKNDISFMVQASTKAQKSADYILNVEYEDGEGEE